MEEKGRGARVSERPKKNREKKKGIKKALLYSQAEKGEKKTSLTTNVAGSKKKKERGL